MVETLLPVQLPTHPTHCLAAGAVPVPQSVEQLPAAVHALHELLAPEAHNRVWNSGPVRPGHPSAARVRLLLPYPQSTEQLLHPLQSLNPIDPHCCVAVKGPAAHDGPHVPATHVRLIVCTPP